jgi:hypothetical protein
MKKQIFILVFLVLATFGSMEKSYGQCVTDPLHPAAGVSYKYQVTVPIADGYLGTSGYNWYVTTNPDVFAGTVVANSGVILTVKAGEKYGKVLVSETGIAQKDIDITWTPQAIKDALTTGKPYFLVVRYGENNGTCDAMNMKAWKITPKNNFLLAVSIVDNLGVAFPGSYCAADVTAALYDVPTDKITYKYGQNTFYSKVVPTGLTGNWTPSIQIPTLAGDQTISELSWSTTIGGTYTAFPSSAGTTGGDYTAATDAAISAADGSLPIFIKLVINNNTHESLLSQNLIIGVDGYYGTVGNLLNDIVGTGATACADEAVYGKSVTQTIMARPTVNDNTTNAPVPTNFIPEVHN